MCIEDIAHALSLTCRFNGHCKHFYSVAHHSVLCCRLASLKGYDYRIRLLALLHDASEAYVTDIPRPMKPFINGYRDMENRVQEVIYRALSIAPPTPKEMLMVKELDQILLATEGKQLMSFDGWGNLPYPPDDRIKIDEIRPQLVEKAFLAKYWKYQICLLKDKKKRELILFRIERMAKLEKFLEALARITLLDWGAVADKLKKEISIEAIASGLNIVDRVAWIGAIDSQIHAEMKNEEEARNTIINAENGQ